jgi:mono/diheme cytochrome c family protein
VEFQVLNGGRLRFVAITLITIPAAQLGIATAQSTAPSSLVETGRYLATAANCISCHTRKGGASFAGGVAFETRFGTLYSTNITPDPNAGIGNWTQAQFMRAMREGIRADGEHLYPAFPYTAFTKLSDPDIVAIYAYLKTVSASPYRAPENDLSFPFNQRSAMIAWKALYLDDARHTPDAKQSAEWNRGAYLVEALGHCGACHTPRNSQGAERKDWALTGGTHKDKVAGGKTRTWSAVNLTQASSGLRAWSLEEITAYLKTGLNSFATSFGPMNEVITNSTSQITTADIRAMAIYLKSLPAKEQPTTAAATADQVRTGQSLYTIHCGTCHLPTGKGSKDTGPSMAGNPVVQATDPASLINVILYGPDLPNPPPPLQRMHMDPYESELGDDEVAAIASYMRSAWGNRAGAVSVDQVAAQR